jgi:nitrogen fixation protein FixH
MAEIKDTEPVKSEQSGVVQFTAWLAVVLQMFADTTIIAVGVVFIWKFIAAGGLG